MSVSVQLTSRQQEILRRLVEEYVASGQPVGSKTLADRIGLTASPSTVRAELAELEALGLLTHPHTSAGRVPTESGYRLYADGLLKRPEPHPAPEFPLDLHTQRTEVEEALQTTTEMLSHVTRLLALVSAPPLQATMIVRIEVLLLQPELVMVVVITSAGGVTKRNFQFEHAVDPGLAQWAGEYLNETVAGLQLGTALLRRRFEDQGLSQRERAFLAVLRPSCAPRSSTRTGASSSSSRSALPCSTCSASLRSSRGGRTCAWARSSTIPPCVRSRSSARATGSSIARSAR